VDPKKELEEEYRRKKNLRVRKADVRKAAKREPAHLSENTAKKSRPEGL